MLEWTTAGDGRRLGMLVLHDDEEREYAYGPAPGCPTLIPIPLSSDRREPVEGAERADAAGFAAKPCPRGTAGVEDVIVGRPEAVREEALAQVEPDPLDGVQLGRVGRQEDRGDVGRDRQLFGGMPAGAIQDDDRMGAGRHGRGELVEHGLHRDRAHLGQNQGHAVVALGADRAEEVDGLVPQVAPAARADALLEPAAAGAAGLADPGLVQEPDLEVTGLGMGGRDLGDQRWELFLNACWALGLACGWTGRVFCQERSSPCSRSSMPFSL